MTECPFRINRLISRLLWRRFSFVEVSVWTFSVRVQAFPCKRLAEVASCGSTHSFPYLCILASPSTVG
jgi:hypothetical protein